MSASIVIQVCTGHFRAASDLSMSVAVRLQIGRVKLLSRLVYIARLAYWTARHRSIDRARWVVEYEGHTW